MIVDVVVDLQYGDCGKGKVTHSLLKSGEYTHCIRFAGGHNAGHTIIHNGRKVVTHVIPSGILHGVRSIIGPGCVVNIDKLNQEIAELEEIGIQVEGNLFIDKRAHLISKDHIEEDSKDKDIGTTKTGNGPAYRDKYARKGHRVEQLMIGGEFALAATKAGVIDLYEELHLPAKRPVVLMEGAQGFGLDIDWGDYPYVTSSHCTTAGSMLCGIPPKAIRRVYGVCKAYETYVGTKAFQGSDSVFSQMQKIGNEFGATTGRPRQCNYLNADLLLKAVHINGVTDLIVNKMDVLQEIKHWAVRYNDGDVIKCFDEHDFKILIENLLAFELDVDDIKYSYSPEDI